MILHDDLVMVTEREFRELPEYSCSLPTGQTIGKKWKRQKDYYDESKGWLMGEYIPDPDPEMVGIRWRDLVLWENAVGSDLDIEVLVGGFEGEDT